MKPEKQRLIHDLMNDGGEDARRTETLLTGVRVLRRRRHLRHAKQALAVLGIAALAALCVQQWLPRNPLIVARPPQVPPAAVASTGVHRLTDDELLAMFPDVPVGLATLSDGRKKLIFPRPGDEARFIRHL
jgi:hypothetical protein